MIKLGLLAILSTLSIYISITGHIDKPRQWSSHVRSLNHELSPDDRYCSASNIEYEGKNFIITNKHCCEQNKYVLVNNYMGKVIKIDEEHDLCAIESDREEGLYISEEEPEIMDKVWLIGHPRGLPLIIREGRIVDKGIEICLNYDSGYKCLLSDMISALAYGGNSGSPVLNEDGEIIGILFAGSPAYPHEPYIVPHFYLKTFLQELVDE